MPCNACGRSLVREASNVHLTKMRSVSLIRCLPKMSPSSSTPTGSQMATWRRSIFNMDTSRVQLRSLNTVDGKDVCLTTGISHWTRLSAIFFHTVNHNSDLTVRLHVTTSLKSISRIRWLYHLMFKRWFHQFNSLHVNHVTNHSSFSLVNAL